MQCHDGGCLCGNVRFRVTTPMLDSGYCHCRMCQKNSGAPVTAWATFCTSGFSWIIGEPRTYSSSTSARREFCAGCGSYLAFRSDIFPGEVSVNTASFDDPVAFPPRKHIFVESRIPWFHAATDLPSYEGYGPIGEGDSGNQTLPAARQPIVLPHE